MAATATKQTYSRREVCRWLEISERQVRSWERQKLIPTLAEYSIGDAAILRTLAGLRKKEKMSAPALRRAIAGIRERFVDLGDPLTEVKLYADGKRIRVQFGSQKMEPVSGQLLFNFDAAEINKLLAFPSRRPSEPAGRPTHRAQAEAWFEKGLLLEKSGAAMDEIVDAYQQAAKIDPSSAGALVNLGTVYFNSRRWREAEQYYKMALEVDGEYALAHFNLANLYDERGNRHDALRHYLSALRIHPNYADAHYNIALLHQASGQSLKAVRHWNAYLKLDPGSEWSQIARKELGKLRESTIVSGARSE